jgi:hypothetical protein
MGASTSAREARSRSTDLSNNRAPRRGAANTPSSILSVVALIPCTLAAACSVDVAIVRGRVDHAPGNAIIRVQRVHAKDYGRSIR